LLLAAHAAHAGRPLTVDDAGTNAKGEGHVEVWASRADHATTLNLSPAYAIRDGLELAALLARDTANDVTGSAVQIKALFTPSRERGCNIGATLGAVHTSANGTSSNGAFVNGLFSCNGAALGNLHLNLGATKSSGRSTIGSWGLALEREFGPVTPHIEWFGAEGSKPTWQIGARGDLAKAVQLDGTIGRGDGITLYSVGVKLRF
jgi:hypothetical protein